MKVAIVGSGISGLSAAWSIADWANVTVYESANRLGGHTHTHLVPIHGVNTPVDTGFIVFNHRTYPGLKKWFETLGVATAPSDMSFSASLDQGRLEWCGSDLNTVFAQRKNLASPRFWSMLAEIIRFNRHAPKFAGLIRAGKTAPLSLGEYLDTQRYGQLFLDAYLLPMAGAIWSCPVAQMRAFPMETFTRFCENHGLLQITDRPQWFSVRGGSKTYIDRMQEAAIKTNKSIRWATGHAIKHAKPVGPADTAFTNRVVIHGLDQNNNTPFSETYDAVVLACHSDQSAEILKESGLQLQKIAQQVRYQNNHAVLHTDIDLMPKRKNAWASWNYLHDTATDQREHAVSVTYWMNRLQDLPVSAPVLVTLNPTRMPRRDLIIREMHYAHPIFDGPATAAQQALSQHQGEGGIWLAGAWTRYGFHEDGFQSGQTAAQLLRQQFAAGQDTAYARAA
jgi:predicted NAD/FAD-binding protein